VSHVVSRQIQRILGPAGILRLFPWKGLLISTDSSMATSKEIIAELVIL
jgi:hypothetical protein